MLSPEFCKEQLASTLDGLEKGNLVSPRLISTGNWENFVVLTRTLGDLLLWDTAEDTLTHEGQHLWATHIVGAEAIRFQITIDPDKGVVEPAVVTQYLERHTPLHAAAVSVYPTTPSVGDIENMRADGFNSVEEVAEAAIGHNLAHGNDGDRIPIPLSHQPATGFVERVAYL